jgi:hypothetical protein
MRKDTKIIFYKVVELANGKEIDKNKLIKALDELKKHLTRS